MSDSLNESAARAWREERARAELARAKPRLASVPVGADPWEAPPLPEGEDAYGIQAPSEQSAPSNPPLPPLTTINASALAEEPPLLESG